VNTEWLGSWGMQRPDVDADGYPIDDWDDDTTGQPDTHDTSIRVVVGNVALEMLPSFVRVTFGVRDPGRRRDPHNYMPTVKAIIDGLVDAGVWPDDTPEDVA